MVLSMILRSIANNCSETNSPVRSLMLELVFPLIRVFQVHDTSFPVDRVIILLPVIDISDTSVCSDWNH